MSILTVVAITCKLVSNMALCEEVIIPTDQMSVGQVQPPAIQHYTNGVPDGGWTVYDDGKLHESIPLPPMSMDRCATSADGWKAAIDFISQQIEYQHVPWYIQNLKCVPGKYEPSKRA